jgi:hypothetical protein
VSPRPLLTLCCAGLPAIALSLGQARPSATPFTRAEPAHAAPPTRTDPFTRPASSRAPAPTARAAQDRLVTIRVLADADGSPLANAEVIDRGTGARALTRENGEARVRLPLQGELLLRVRQLGYAYLDLTLEWATLPGGGEEPVVVRLARIPFALPSVSTTAARDCPPIDDNVKPLALWALDQLREGAERYETFRQAYPFRVEIERNTVRRNRMGQVTRANRSRERGDSERWGDRYTPGAVVALHPLGFSVPILFVATLGDPAFWDHHCITTARVEGSDSLRQVRLRFAPSPSAKGSDWGGDALMDSSTSLLRRIEFHLRINQKDGPRRFEGYTTFRSPSSLIVVPESTFAMWWRAEPDAGAEWGLPDVVQLVRSLEIEYRKSRPPR